MTDQLEQRINALLDTNCAPTLTGMRRGIEKESLRITPEGTLAQTPHPQALGSALSHPWITTDYSEALLEFITPPSDQLETPLAFLDDLHRYTYQHIGDERLWVNSMPCIMGNENRIPVATYGRSNIGRMKYIYRLGLGLRYGRRMQTIAGIHYNLSYPDAFWKHHQQLEQDNAPLQDFISRRYFDLLRNFQRYSWLLLYLFGASPAICNCFLAGREHQLENRYPGTLHNPWATSLRMSDLGYQNNAQSTLNISYNSLEDYVRTLTDAIMTEDPVYKQHGVCNGDDYHQLNTSILQIENEYYSSIRPKRSINPGERPTLALARRGVEYIEIRALDLNPFAPLGIDQQQIRFLDIFASYCLLRSSPDLGEQDFAASRNNILDVVYQGRDPQLKLCDWGTPVLLRDWGSRILEQMNPIAELFDRTHQSQDYSNALQAQKEKILDANLTPSAQVLAALETRQQGFFDFAMDCAEKHRDHFMARPLPSETEQHLQKLASNSLLEQANRDNANEIPFEDFLAAYFADRSQSTPARKKM